MIREFSFFGEWSLWKNVKYICICCDSLGTHIQNSHLHTQSNSSYKWIWYQHIHPLRRSSLPLPLCFAHTHIRRIRAFILLLGIWLFRGAVSTSLPWSATSSSSDLSTHAAGLWAQQNQPKEQSTTINNGILRELCNTRRIRSQGDDFLMENNARCLVFVFWLIYIETAEETAGKLKFTLRWTIKDTLVNLHLESIRRNDQYSFWIHFL